ncbi:hypothetical protein [Bowmanella denitrificans]|uniref:hypothetical protein n=1 Tax=Bowmanella denitrificans TaxID=366582 RepID=UPI000C9C65A8|nr:hypothetical protein [Bowmanella denitrificans]
MALTKADVAKLVKRTVYVPKLGKDKQPMLHQVTKVPLTEPKQVDVQEEEVLDWIVRGGEITVVTTDGRKLLGEVPADIAKKHAEA